MDRLTKKQKKALTLIGTTAAVYVSFKYLLPLVVPFLLAFLLVQWLNPSAVFLSRRLHIPKGLTVAVSILLILTGVTVGLFFLCRRLIPQLQLFSAHFPQYLSWFDLWLTNSCDFLETSFHLKDGLLLAMAHDAGASMGRSIKSNTLPFLASYTLPFAKWIAAFFTFILVVWIASILSAGELDRFRRWTEVSLFHKEIKLISHRLGQMGGAYLKVQLIIMTLTSIVCVLGLFFLKNEYALLFGIGIGLMDALPLFGTGLVFLPWIFVELIIGNYFQAGALSVIYLICYFLREIIEAKLLGGEIGISPLETLISMYVGLKLFGLGGFLLGPAGLIIIKGFLETEK